MEENLIAIEAPRFEDGELLLIAGLSERYTYQTSFGIPAQWQRFVPYLGHVPEQSGSVTYGVCCNSDDKGNFDYICGVEVSGFASLAPPLTGIRIPPCRYAVFSHHDHISTIRSVLKTIWSKWLPESGHQAADAPNFERYGAEFNPTTGMGGFEIRIPLRT